MRKTNIFIDIDRPTKRGYGEEQIHRRLRYDEIEVVLLGMDKRTFLLEVYYKLRPNILNFFNSKTASQYLLWNIKPHSEYSVLSSYGVVELTMFFRYDQLSELPNDIFMAVASNMHRIK